MADRYWLCGDDCTTDCGVCKGAGRPAAVPDPRFRDQLEATAHQSIQQASWARGVAMLDSDVAAFRQRLLDDLMPLVEARVQAAANQRAAEVDVERAARAMHEIPAQPGVYGRIPWERLMEQHREAYRQMARAAASALASENEGVKA